MDTYDLRFRPEFSGIALPFVGFALATLLACGSSEPGDNAEPDTTIGDDAGGDGVEEDTGVDAGETSLDDGGSDANIGSPCDDDEDCIDGLWCFAQECSRGDCDRGETQCSDSDALESCVRGVFVAVPCGPAEVCSDADGVAACAAPACEPASIGCIDNSTAFLCDDDGGARTELPCRADQYCDAGVCLAQVCEPGESSCDGIVATACDDRGATQTANNCGEDCDASGGCACEDGACIERVCAPTTRRCDGNTVVACDAAGETETRIACGGDEICVAGDCVVSTCEANVVECIGETLSSCDETGASRSLVDCTAVNSWCDGDRATPTCVDRVCVPLAQTCADSTTRRVCDARGSDSTLVACPSATFCSSGACLPNVCTPGSSRCTGNTRETCRADGSGYDSFDCNSLSQSCVASGATATCVARVCTPSSRTCTDTLDAVRVCNAAGTAVTTETCAAVQHCSAGACIADVCTANARSCEGDVLRICNSAGSGSTTTNCTASGRVCDDSGTPTCVDAEECLPGSVTCEAGNLARCNADGRGYTLEVDCPGACSPVGYCIGRGEGSTCTTNSNCDSNNCTGGVCAPSGTVFVPPGNFTMGTNRVATHIDSGLESPAHVVAFSRGFYFSRTEVTQNLWSTYVATNPSIFVNCGSTCPVETVSWYDAVWFANLISEAAGLTPCYELVSCSGTPGGGCPPGTTSGFCTGDYSCAEVRFPTFACTGYRLPTEAEWEWAIGRGAGNTADYVAGGLLSGSFCGADPALTPYAIFCGNSAVTWAGCANNTSGGGAACAGPSPVGSRAESPTGIYDGLGNVYEWVWDGFNFYTTAAETNPVGPTMGTEAIRRGGAWWSWNRNTRLTNRFIAAPTSRSNLAGIRLVRTAFPVHCDNDVRDAGETGIDCGGTCAVCD